MILYNFIKGSFKFGFTLAEVMIVLTVIGVLAGILIPVANNSRPDENVMKFKKAHATFTNIIHELVTSDKYYGNGDLGLKPNGTTLINGTNAGDFTYFCQTIADVASTKKINCSDKPTNKNGYTAFNGEYSVTTLKNYIDSQCETMESIITEPEIIFTDNVIFYRENPKLTFGASNKSGLTEACFNSDGTKKEDSNHAWCNNFNFETLSNENRFFGGKTFIDSNGFDYNYMNVCIDIDGIKKGENPFGYGIRSDGKIMTGARADEWLEKDFQKGKNDN